MKTIIDEARVPSGGFIFINPEDGSRFVDDHFHRLRDRVGEYRRANNYPVGLIWGEHFVENVCNNSPNACHEFTPPTPRQKIESAVRAMGDWASSGFKLAGHDLAEKRMEVCRSCQFFSGERSAFKVHCGSCGCSSLKLLLKSSKCPVNKW